jgi:hypothetical protein
LSPLTGRGVRWTSGEVEGVLYQYFYLKSKRKKIFLIEAEHHELFHLFLLVLGSKRVE